MTSVLKTFAQNPFGATNAVLSGGNGSNGTTERAIATIDPRFGNTFIIDATGLTNSGAGEYRVHILVKSVKANVGATMPGKVIHLIFKVSSVTDGITCYFDSSLGYQPDLTFTPPADPPAGYTVLPISLIANGSQFQLLNDSDLWAEGD
jgi:hypothetical protein